MRRVQTKFLRGMRGILVLAVLVFTLAGVGVSLAMAEAAAKDPALAQAPKSNGSVVYITLGKADIIDVGGDVADIMIANPSVVEASAVQSNRLYIAGSAVGDTNIIVLDTSGNVLRKLDVHVRYDTKVIQNMISTLYPDEHVNVGAIHDQIVLTGRVSTPAIAGKIGDLVGHYVSDLQDKDKTTDELVANLLDVNGEQQVMLRVKILEASRTVLKELGINTSANDPDELSATTLFGSVPPSDIARRLTALGIDTASTGLTQDPFSSVRLLRDTKIDGFGVLQIVLNALEQKNLVNILAEPNLTSVSGEQAGFLAGGEFPVPVGRDQIGNLVIEFRQFGVSLNFKPTVLSKDRISLQLNTEVSSLDKEKGITLADVEVPGLDVRRAQTTVEVPSGGSLMIAGLLKSEATNGLSGLPGIMDVPVLGKLVSSDSFRRDETELVVIVTPFLVEPYAQKQEYAKEVPAPEAKPLAKAFLDNLLRIFGARRVPDLSGETAYGYILD